MIIGIKPEVWFPVMTLFLGALAKGIGDWLLESRKARTDREARRETREESVRAKVIEFQRTTLLELQEAAQALARATGRSQHEDRMAFRQSGAWGKNQYSEGANQSSLDANISLTRLRVRWWLMTKSDPSLNSSEPLAQGMWLVNPKAMVTRAYEKL